VTPAEPKDLRGSGLRFCFSKRANRIWTPNTRSKLHVHTKRRHQYRTAVTVVAGMIDVLKSKRRVNPPPHMDGVIRLDDIFASVMKAAVPSRRPEPPRARYS
jgi:hypothetical protein